MSFVRSFLIAFAVALVVFVPIAYFTVNYVVDEVENGLAQTTDPSDGNNGPSGDGYEIDATGRLSLLLVVTSPVDSPESPSAGGEGGTDIPQRMIDFMTLVYYNCDTRQVMITAFPGDMMIQLQGVSMSVTEGYSYMKSGTYGLTDRYIAESVTGCTGIPIDCYAYIDRTDFERVADEMGGLTVEFSEAFSVYDSSDGSTRFFPRGVNLLSSADLHSLLIYDGYSTASTKMQIISAVCKSVLDQESSTANYLNLESIWAKVYPMYYEYDLGEYDSVRDLADRMFTYRLCTATIVSVKGEYTQINGENLFVVDYSTTISQMKQFSR